jgi:hypothetical protein
MLWSHYTVAFSPWGRYLLRTYIGTFLIAFTTLALEISFTRLFSVITWYHLSFFAIALALLGMTAGATTIYVSPGRFRDEDLDANLAKACRNFALAVPVALIFLSIMRINIALDSTIMDYIALVVATVFMFIPFYFSGMAISLVLTRSKKPIGKLYASDLVGASLGSLFVLGGLEIFDAPSLIILTGAVGALAGLVFVWKTPFSELQRSCGVVLVLLALGAIVNNSAEANRIRPVFVKGEFEDVAENVLERWNSFSRVTVSELKQAPPQTWGYSPNAPTDNIPQRWLRIDGGAATVIRQFTTEADIEHLRYEVANIAYHLRPTGGAFIVGVGGGRDIQSALLFGHEHVVGVDINPVFIDLLENDFRDFAGLADRDEVTLVVDEGRSYLSRTDDRYSVLQMSLIDTWASTGAGAFSLSENALYTVEAWELFYNRLADDGIFTVSRWYSHENLGETGRVTSLATAALLNAGITEPDQHIAMITTDIVATMLVSKSPFSAEDIARLETVSEELGYQVAILPGTPPEHASLRAIVGAQSQAELNAVIADERFNYTPPTDESPYFFNILRLDRIDTGLRGSGVERGNMIATLTLAVLIIMLFAMTLATIIYPLLSYRRHNTEERLHLGQMFPGALYFSLIGAGFMFVEIALIQRLSVFLSHPTYALGLLLFTIILSTGVGSYLSERLPLTQRPWVFVYPIVMVLAIFVMRFALTALLATMMEAPIPVKVVIAVIVMFPLGILMGFFFPTGMRLVGSANHASTPWYWALNGVFGVLCSALAVFVSLYISISTNFYIGAACYSAVLIAIALMKRIRNVADEAVTRDTSSAAVVEAVNR